MKRFYHTSGTRYRVGDFIGGPGKKVFMNDSPIVHGTIWEAIANGYGSYEEYTADHHPKLEKYWVEREAWNLNPTGPKPEYPKASSAKPKAVLVYEVKPFRKPRFGGMNDEWISENEWVEIVRVVGNARGILNNHFDRFGRFSKRSHHFGAKSIRNDRRIDLTRD
jgi:hypothetical protein